MLTAYNWDTRSTNIGCPPTNTVLLLLILSTTRQLFSGDNMANKHMENVRTINSAVRTMLMVAFLGVFGYLSFLGYNQWIKPGLEAEKIKQQMTELQVKFDEQQEVLLKTQTALKLVKVDQRKALIKVLEKGVDQTNDEPYCVVEFTEVDPDGVSISEPREFRLRGNRMYIDCWIVKFEDKYIEQADALRSASLCVFKSIYGDIDQMSGGQTLDSNNADIQTAYGTLDPKNAFEEQIWEDFWTLANSTEDQKDLGIRSAHGQVNYISVEPGMIYEMDLRASDGMSLRPSMQTSNTSRSRSSN